MTQSLSEILDKMNELQNQLDDAFKERAQHLRYELKNKRVVFEKEVLDAHRAFRIHLAQRHPDRGAEQHHERCLH